MSANSQKLTSAKNALVPQLVSHRLCPYVQRALIVLIEKNVEHERTYIDLSNKPDWFVAISPLGKVPLLRVQNSVLFESAVICEYLDEVTQGSLHPDDPLERAKHRAWIEFGSAILNDISGFYNAPDKNRFEAKRTALVQKFEWLERNLEAGPFFSGERFSMVDAVYPTVFRYFDAFDHAGDFGFFARTPKVRAYRDSLFEKPSVRAAVVPDYSELLLEFLNVRDAYIATLLEQRNRWGAH